MDIKLVPINVSGRDGQYDLQFTDGLLDRVSGIDEIKQRIIIRLSTHRGELFADRTFGPDYHNNIFGYDITDTIVQDSLKSEILKVTGVTGLSSFSLEMIDRTAVLSADIKTTAGSITLTTPIVM